MAAAPRAAASASSAAARGAAAIHLLPQPHDAGHDPRVRGHRRVARLRLSGRDRGGGGGAAAGLRALRRGEGAGGAVRARLPGVQAEYALPPAALEEEARGTFGSVKDPNAKSRAFINGWNDRRQVSSCLLY